MKWDIAWSDVYGCDPCLRRHFPQAPATVEPPPDSFERTLAIIIGDSRPLAEVRQDGIKKTLGSELHSSLLPRPTPTAAEVGHRAGDLLPPYLEVLYSALTAHVREVAGEPAFAALIERLGRAELEAAPRSAGDTQSTCRQHDIWVQSLVLHAAATLSAATGASQLAVLPRAARRLQELANVSGWEHAVARAETACLLLDGVAALVLAAFGVEGLDLLVRGSAAQGVLGLRSDVDFELSSPDFPSGAQDLERCVAEVLACFSLEAEGSLARPKEADLRSADGRITRDLHEWFELRRPSSTRHHPGWLRPVLTLAPNQLSSIPSQYEAAGREVRAKYLWFEVRAAVSRVIFGALGTDEDVPATLPEQLQILPQLIPSWHAAELDALAHAAFDLRESGRCDETHERVAARLDAVRNALGLPGPATTETEESEGP